MLHSHLGMTGAWGVYARGRPVAPVGAAGVDRVPRRRARGRRVRRAAARADDRGADAVRSAAGRARARRAGGRVRRERFLGRLRSDDQTRPLGDALLDQRNVAGIGNIWKAEGCWEAGVDPWRALRERVRRRGRGDHRGDAAADAALGATRARARSSRGSTGCAGRPCPRCGGDDPSRGQGDANRTTYWCPGCQTAEPRPSVGHKGADLIAPGNTYASFDAALRRRRRHDRVRRAAGAARRPAVARSRLRGRRRPHAPPRSRRGSPTSLGDPFAGIELDRRPEAAGLRARAWSTRCGSAGLLDRALISSQYRASLAADPRRRSRGPPRLVGAQAANATRSARAKTAVPAFVAARGAAGGAAGLAARAIGARPVRRPDGPLAAGDAAAGAGGPRRRRRAVRVDGRRATTDEGAQRARGHRGDHQRPAAVRALRELACDGSRAARSDGVSETLTAPASASDSSWERFEALYRSSRDDVYAYVATLLRDPAAAEDVTALAFERAYRRRRTFDRRRGEERAWLFGIARNAALDELRRRRRVAALVDRARGRRRARPAEDGAEVALRRTAVRSALASCPRASGRSSRSSSTPA